MILGTHNKQPRETRRLLVDYAAWLAEGETLADAVVRFDVVATPPVDAPAPEALGPPWAIPVFSVQSALQGGTAVVVTVAGGVSLTDYRVTVLATTSANQIKEDEIIVSVQEVS